MLTIDAAWQFCAGNRMVTMAHSAIFLQTFVLEARSSVSPHDGNTVLHFSMFKPLPLILSMRFTLQADPCHTCKTYYVAYVFVCIFIQAAGAVEQINSERRYISYLDGRTDE